MDGIRRNKKFLLGKSSRKKSASCEKSQVKPLKLLSTISPPFRWARFDLANCGLAGPIRFIWLASLLERALDLTLSS